jgi:hypothetical protein
MIVETVDVDRILAIQADNPGDHGPDGAVIMSGWQRSGGSSRGGRSLV